MERSVDPVWSRCFLKPHHSYVCADDKQGYYLDKVTKTFKTFLGRNKKGGVFDFNTFVNRFFFNNTTDVAI